MSYKIVKNKDYLHKKTTPVASIEEGNEIANKLIETLNGLPYGLGLSANQIGIPKSVSVIRARKDRPPVILMNPIVTESGSEKLVYLEGCLSLPGKQTTTLRTTKVTVSTLNHANPMPFGPDVEPMTQESTRDDYGILESVVVQHEIDHLNGILMTDDGVRFVMPTKTAVKHGRNDKVVVEKDGQTQYIKYKKALELIGEGWKII